MNKETSSLTVIHLLHELKINKLIFS